MSSSDDPMLKLMTFAFDRAEYEHKDLSDTWKQLDTKAQASIAIAGIFFAAVFVFIRNTSFQPDIVEKWLLGLGIVLLMISVITALLALWVRPMQTPTTTKTLVETIKSVRAAQENGSMPNVVGVMVDYLPPWATANERLRDGVRGKAQHIVYSQVALLFASLFIVVGAVYGLLR